MKTILLLISLLFIGSISFSQTEKKAPIPFEIAQYVGGSEAMNAYFQKAFKKQKAEASGTVYIEFTISKEGKVLNPKIIKGIHAKCDERALKAIAAMPNWLPAKDAAGGPMESQMTLPIKFEQ